MSEQEVKTIILGSASPQQLYDAAMALSDIFFQRYVDMQAAYNSVQKYNGQLKEQVAAMRQALEMVDEWAGELHSCPCCHNFRWEEKHKPDCLRQLALGMEKKQQDQMVMDAIASAVDDSMDGSDASDPA
jgi:hypothetical protein